MSSDTTDKKLKNLVLFKSGAEWTGNRSGRPKGSRNKLGEQYCEDVYELWQAHGKAILLEAARRDPPSFVRMVASLLPRNVKVDVDAGDAFIDLLQKISEKQVA